MLLCLVNRELTSLDVPNEAIALTACSKLRDLLCHRMAFSAEKNPLNELTDLSMLTVDVEEPLATWYVCHT